jgi:hypothetical protein
MAVKKTINHLLFAPLPYGYVMFELLGVTQQCRKI